jgi:hypothetical protein
MPYYDKCVKCTYIFSAQSVISKLGNVMKFKVWSRQSCFNIQISKQVGVVITHYGICSGEARWNLTMKNMILSKTIFLSSPFLFVINYIFIDITHRLEI